MVDITKLNFEKSDGLIACVVQDAVTEKVLMVGYMNREALLKSIETRLVTFYSRSKQRLWTKGETSKNYLNLTAVMTDCDSDALLIKANPTGPVCHTGADTCFNERNPSFNLKYLEQIIHERIQNPSPNSYTSKLLSQGINKVAQKVGEEAVELVIEAKDDDQKKFLDEAADLTYHYLLLLAAKNVSLDEVIDVLGQRHQAKS